MKRNILLLLFVFIGMSAMAQEFSTDEIGKTPIDIRGSKVFVKDYNERADYLRDRLDLAEDAGGNDDTALACYDEANAGNRELAKKDDENHPNEDESLGDLASDKKVCKDRNLRADDQKFVGEGIDELAEVGDEIILSCDLTVEHVGDGGNQEYKRRNDEPPDLDATHKKKREHECGNQKHTNK